ncbi:MAG TPA: glycosyltransferase family 39 protein, partial [Tepidisphaeraceae bacterium]
MNVADKAIQTDMPAPTVAEPGGGALLAPTLAPAPVVTPLDSEPRWKRLLFLALALAISAGVCFFLFSFLAPGPGRPGIDENAYLVGGRMIAEHGTTGFKPTDDYQFVGAMWLRTKDGWYYPKYPFGVALIDAAMIKIGHPLWAFGLSPACTALAILGMFFLARRIVGSFYALLAMIVLAMGPTTLYLAQLPNSHAPALCVVVWGMFFLLWWWQTGRWQLGVVAGLLLGFAVAIRYTEALLLFPLHSLTVLKPDQYIGPKLITIFKIVGLLPLGPIGIAVLSQIKWKDWRSYVRAGVPIFAWAVPVGALVTFNWFTVGHLTGYDNTNESNGFSVDYFVNKWDFAVYQVYLFGLFVFAPLGIAGLVLMYRSGWRNALMLTLWFVPGALLYTAYYWGANMPSIGFLRFFLTLFPPLIIAGTWLLRSTEGGGGKGSIAAPLAAGVLVAITASIGLWTSLGELQRQHRGTLNLEYSSQRIMAHLRPGWHRPMILADTGLFPQLLQYMQYLYDADWYASDIFAPRNGGGFGLAGVFQKIGDSKGDAPVALQRERIEYIDSVRKGKTEADFIHDAQNLMNQAISADRKVFVVLSPAESEGFRRRFFSSGGLEMVELERWVEPCAVKFPDPGERNWLGLPVWGDDGFIPWHPQSRAMFEIRRRSPST